MEGFFLSSMFIIWYGLLSYAIIVDESDQIVSKSFRPPFNPMDIHRNFPGDVAVLLAYYLGLSVPKPYVESDIVWIITFINNMGSETLTSKFIMFALQLLQIETGQTEDILL